MRILADENVHRRVIWRLREAGHDVEWVRDLSRGARDGDILKRTDIGDLLFVTCDRDFGDLIFHQGQPQPLALIYSRLPHRDHEITASKIIAELENGIVPKHILTLTRKGRRSKPFPAGATND